MIKYAYMIDLDTALTLIFLVLPLIFAFICLYYAFAYLKSARALQDIPTSKIRSAAQGYVELRGTCQSLLPQPIVGPLSERPCAWYYYTIEEITTTLNENQETVSNWTMVEQGISSNPFVIEDGTGECVILPFNAEIISRSVMMWRGHTRIAHPPTPSFFRALFWENWGNFRYTEQRVELNTPLYVSGNFRTYSKDNPLVESNPYLKAYCDTKNLSSLNLLSKADLEKNERFIISVIEQERLVRQFNWKSLIFFMGFVFFTFLLIKNTYPIVKKGLQAWPIKNIQTHIIR
jgi:hypothetical protein